MKLTPEEIAYAYCENEIYAGYPCRVEGCPHCGGPDEADRRLTEIEGGSQ